MEQPRGWNILDVPFLLGGDRGVVPLFISLLQLYSFNR